MKKTLSLILALLMSLSTAAVAFADETIPEDVTDEVVEDVVEVSPYDEALVYLNKYEIMKGDENGDLKADADVTRTHMALFVSRISTGWTSDSKWAQFGTDNYTPYTDLAGSYAEKVIGALTYADENGIIKGVGDNRFAPEANVSYQDALTMAVRTLGYTNLSYPWGFITKAIELGLTEGIEEAVFTAPITRGVAAQIIYNALMAPTKAGGTLALKNFGTEFGWEDVVIVSSSRDVLEADAKAPAGSIGFKVVVDGELVGYGEENKPYLAPAASFDLDVSKYEDITAVGTSYRVFFESNEKGYTDCFDVKSNYVETLWNAEGEKAIAGDYSITTQYADNTNWKPTAAVKELIVVDAFGGIVAFEDSNLRVGIDFATDNIVKYSIDEDGVAKIEEVLWWYNDLKDSYYTLVAHKEDKNVIGIKYMDAEDEAELREMIEEIKIGEAYTDFTKGFATPVAADKLNKNAAYASLEVYEVNDKYYGIFEEYRFGKFANTTIAEVCGHNKNVAAYSLTNVFNMATAKTVLGADLNKDLSDLTRAIALGNTTGCDTCKNYVTAWINPDYAANYDAEEEAYLDGYVIYSVDKQTGEIKIVKYIGELGTEYATEDDYVTYGTVRAYDVKTESVVINGVPYTFNYDNLAGTALVNVNKDNSATYRQEYSDNLRDWFNQFVEIVVVDGEIVHMEVAAADEEKWNDFFVVERYAGISSDGYIVVDGYWVDADGVKTLSQARIATIDNAYTGDLFYYLTETKINAYFDKGIVYFVSSVNEDGALNVQVAFEDGEVSEWFDVTEDFVVSAEDTARFEDKGWIVKGTDTTKFVKNDADTYILILADETETTEDDRVIVYTGKLEAGWKVVGDKLPISGATVLVNAVITPADKAFKANSAASGIVALVNDRYWSADFDGAVNNDPWYLLGSSNYEVEVFDFVQLKYVGVAVRNLNLKEGYIYDLTGGTIVYDNKYTADTLETKLAGIYTNAKFTDAEYSSKTDFAAEAKKLSKTYSKDLGYKNEWEDVASIAAVILVDTNKEGTKFEDITVYAPGDAAAAIGAVTEAKDDVVTLEGFKFINLDDGKIYIYLYEDGAVAATEGVEVEGGVGTKEIIVVPGVEDAYIDVVIGAETTTKTVGDKTTVTGATLNTVTFEYIGAATKDTHASVKADDLYFGLAGECEFENWDTTVDGEFVYGSIVSLKDGVYTDHDTEDVCNLVKKVTIALDDVAVKENEWTRVIVKFTGTKLDGEAVEYIITLCAIVEDGKLYTNVDYNNGGCLSIGGAGVNVIARTEIVK